MINWDFDCNSLLLMVLIVLQDTNIAISLRNAISSTKNGNTMEHLVIHFRSWRDVLTSSSYRSTLKTDDDKAGLESGEIETDADHVILTIHDDPTEQVKAHLILLF